MIKIGSIHVDGKGKKPEEIKEEICNALSKQVDEMFDQIGKSKKKKKCECKEPQYIKLLMEEDDERQGFGVGVEFEGKTSNILTMLTVGVAEALHEIMHDEEGEGSIELLKDFVNALIEEYINQTPREDDNEEEEEDD